MNAKPFALALGALLLASCGGEGASDTAQATDAQADATGVEASAPAANTAPAVQGEQSAYAPGELLPGGAVDVLQREGFRPPA